MKKVTLICTTLAVALTASAQWNSDKNPIQVTSTLGAFQPKAALTSDGKMFVSWRTAKAVEGGAVCYAFSHLQLLDRDGNALFLTSPTTSRLLGVATIHSSSLPTIAPY